ncbi:MAG: hypothetical protein FWG32_02595 [Oscillospiraceae bacterium]|nr:hypothetical protein [Oscillospiraceae bacterium]
MNIISEISGANHLLSNPAKASISTEPQPPEQFADVYREAFSGVSDETPGIPQTQTAPVNSLIPGEYFSETLRDALVGEMLSAASSVNSSSEYAPLSGLGIESMLLSSAASGEINDAQLAMFMLCMMINISDGDSDKAMLYNAMSTLLAQMPATTAASSSTSSGFHTPSKVFRPTGWDGQIRDMFLPTASRSGMSIVPSSAWIPTIPAKISTQETRSPELLRSVIDQFNVENSLRYRPYRNGPNDTYCNIFVWDVTSALGCEIPHFVDYKTGEPRMFPDIQGAYELDANGIQDWLRDVGPLYGWREVSPETAQMYANNGRPAVTSWQRLGGIGHVQIVCPSEDGEYDPVRGPTISQAGRRRSNYSYQVDFYGPAQMQKVRYYVHD